MTEIRTTSSTGGQKGVKLAKHSLIPSGPLNALAEHYGVGAFKYADHQWRKGYEYSKSYDALQRHATEWLAGKSHDTCSNANWEGCQDVDADGNDFTAPRDDACYNHTGSHHMSAVAWHAFCIQEFEAEYPEHDDRYGADLRRELEAAEREKERLKGEVFARIKASASEIDPEAPMPEGSVVVSNDDFNIDPTSPFAKFDDEDLGPYLEVTERSVKALADLWAAPRIIELPNLGEQSIVTMEWRPRFSVDTGGIVMDDDEDGPMTVAESFRDAMERVFRRR